MNPFPYKILIRKNNRGQEVVSSLPACSRYTQKYFYSETYHQVNFYRVKSRKLGQHPIFVKKGSKNFTTPYSIPFPSVLHQIKVLHNFSKRGKCLIAGYLKDLDKGLFDVLNQNSLRVMQEIAFVNLYKTYFDTIIIPFLIFHFEWKKKRENYQTLKEKEKIIFG